MGLYSCKQTPLGLFVALSVFVCFISTTSAANFEDRHTVPHSHLCTRRYPEWSPMSIPPPLPQFWPHGVSRIQYPGKPEYLPLKIDYSMPHFQSGEDGIVQKTIMGRYDPPSLGNDPITSPQELFEPAIHSLRTINDEQPILYRIKKRKQSKQKKRKKKPKPEKVSELSPPEETTPNYSINKIIVIEEGDNFPKMNHHQFENPPAAFGNGDRQIDFQKLKDMYSLQITTPTTPSREHEQTNQKQVLTASTGSPSPVNHLLGSVSIESIQDIHKKLNQSLLANKNELLVSTKSPLAFESNRISNESTVKRLFGSGANTSKIFENIPTAQNVTYLLRNDSAHSTKYTGSSDFFLKGNRFSFQNSWNFLTSTESSVPSVPKENENKNNNSQATNQRKTGDWPPLRSTNIKNWSPIISTTLSPASMYFFTSQRTVLPNQSSSSMLSRTSTTKQTPSNKSKDNSNDKNTFAARKRGQVHEKEKVVPIDMAKVGSIVFGFCISMMLLAGVILVVLHKETVTERFRSISNMIETRYPMFRGSNQTGNGAQPGPNSGNQPESPTGVPSTAQSSESEQRINQDLIEQIIGRPDNNFNNKKCRQYFSRVHRWVPKRPPLPADLKNSSPISSTTTTNNDREIIEHL